MNTKFTWWQFALGIPLFTAFGWYLYRNFWADDVRTTSTGIHTGNELHIENKPNVAAGLGARLVPKSPLGLLSAVGVLAAVSAAGYFLLRPPTQSKVDVAVAPVAPIAPVIGAPRVETGSTRVRPTGY